MSDPTTRIGPSRGGMLAPVRDRKRGTLTERGGDADGRQRVVRHDPFDLETAFYRLALLLERDDGAPPENVPRRGYYLNVLV